MGVLDVVEGFEWWVENAVAFSNREGDADAGLDLGPVLLAQVTDHGQIRAMNRQHVGSETRCGAESADRQSNRT